jgi:TrmH family RNA methyltransferase
MPRAETISSAANPLLKDVRRAIQRGDLTQQGWCIAESFHLLDEALGSDCRIHAVLAAEPVRSEAEARVRRKSGIKVVSLPDALFQSIAATENSQGVMALVSPPVWTLAQVFGARPLVIVLDALQDPGNAGAIVRTAEAFGATGAIFLKGTVSPFNPKTLRASAGSLFRLPYLHGVDPELARDAFEQRKVRLYAALPSNPGGRRNGHLPIDSDSSVQELSDIDFTINCGLIIGNEAHGVGEPLRSAARAITIPTAGVESLNAAVAAGVLLYEARRQRALRP